MSLSSPVTGVFVLDQTNGLNQFLPFPLSRVLYSNEYLNSWRDDPEPLTLPQPFPVPSLGDAPLDMYGFWKFFAFSDHSAAPRQQSTLPRTPFAIHQPYKQHYRYKPLPNKFTCLAPPPEPASFFRWATSEWRLVWIISCLLVLSWPWL